MKHPTGPTGPGTQARGVYLRGGDSCNVGGHRHMHGARPVQRTFLVCVRQGGSIPEEVGSR